MNGTVDVEASLGANYFKRCRSKGGEGRDRGSRGVMMMQRNVADACRRRRLTSGATPIARAQGAEYSGLLTIARAWV